MSTSANTQANENAQNEATKKAAEIKILDHPKFEGNFKSLYTNTIELAELVDSVFGDFMRDYCGCKIQYNDGKNLNVPVGKFYVELIFKDRSNISDEFPIDNLVRRSDIKSSSVLDALKTMTGNKAGRSYRVTDETYEVLDKFRFNPNQKVNWLAMTSEKVTSYGYVGNNNQEIAVWVSGIDLEKVIEEVYGRRTEDGIFEYQAVPANFVANSPGEYVVQITQLDANKLSDLRKIIGGPIVSSEYHQFIR